MDDFDFDAAASAFPDISLDGTSEFPAAAPPAAAAPAGPALDEFSFDALDSPPPRDVKVTGDDEIEKFEDQFPDIGAPAVRTCFVPTARRRPLPAHRPQPAVQDV